MSPLMVSKYSLPCHARSTAVHSLQSRTSKPDIMPAASSIRWGIESRIPLLLIFTSTCQFVLVVCQSHPRTLAQLGTAFLNLISRVILCSSVRRKLCIKHLSMFSTCVALRISSTCLSYLPSCANSGVASSSGSWSAVFQLYQRKHVLSVLALTDLSLFNLDTDAFSGRRD